MSALSPQARSLVAFAIGFTYLTGAVGPGYLLGAALYPILPDGKTGAFLVSLVSLALAVAVLWLAHTAVVALDATVGWDLHLAQAARVIALLAVVFATLVTISTLTNQAGPLGMF